MTTVKYEDLLKIKNDLGLFNQPNVLNRPDTIAGMKIIEEHPNPRMKLSEKVNVSDEFRREFDAWLLNVFGYQDSLLGKNHFYMFNDMVVMKPEIAALIRDYI